MLVAQEVILESCFLIEFPYMEEHEAAKKMHAMQSEEERLRRVVDGNENLEVKLPKNMFCLFRTICALFLSRIVLTFTEMEKMKTLHLRFNCV